MNANITAHERKYDTNRQYCKSISWRDVTHLPSTSSDTEC